MRLPNGGQTLSYPRHENCARRLLVQNFRPSGSDHRCAPPRGMSEGASRGRCLLNASPSGVDRKAPEAAPLPGGWLAQPFHSATTGNVLSCELFMFLAMRSQELAMCSGASSTSRPELFLIDPSEVSHPDADGPADVSAPATVDLAPSLEAAVVPSVIDKHLD
jgi:hypothetical protein